MVIGAEPEVVEPKATGGARTDPKVMELLREYGLFLMGFAVLPNCPTSAARQIN